MTPTHLRTHLPISTFSITCSGPVLRSTDLPGFRWQSEDAPGQVLMLDLRRVEYVTADGLGGLVALHAAIRDAGGRLSLCNVKPCPFEVFRLCRLDEVLDIRSKALTV